MYKIHNWKEKHDYITQLIAEFGSKELAIKSIEHSIIWLINDGITGGSVRDLKYCLNMLRGEKLPTSNPLTFDGITYN